MVLHRERREQIASLTMSAITLLSDSAAAAKFGSGDERRGCELTGTLPVE
jgi:hypothetical protein